MRYRHFYFININMTLKEWGKAIVLHKWLVFWLVVLGAVLAFDLVVIQEPDYRVDSRLVVIQKQTAGQDIYTISKSAQYLTRILKESVYSDDFFNKALTISPELNINDFSDSVKERREQWEKMIEINEVRDLGIMEIAVFDPERKRAVNINEAVTQGIKDYHSFYHGGNNNVTVRILDQPRTGEKPFTLNLWLAAISGGILGFLAGATIVLLKDRQKLAF